MICQQIHKILRKYPDYLESYFLFAWLPIASFTSAVFVLGFALLDYLSTYQSPRLS